jgi:hypothetical protein
VTITANSAAAVLLRAMRPGAPPAVAAAASAIRELLADEILVLEAYGWVQAGGPDGEQLYCLADLLGDRLAGDERLRTGVEDAVHGDRVGVAALDSLAAWLRGAGHAGASEWCRESAGALRVRVRHL